MSELDWLADADTDALRAAPMLIGMRLRSEVDGEVTEVVITETEAYLSVDDPASHSRSGETLRNRSMFASGGTLYVYRSYGIHWCLNIVTGPVGRGEAVLVRAGVVSAGEPVMRRRRRRPDHLVDGPGKLAQALGVTGDLDGTSLRDGPLGLLAGPGPAGPVVATPRIGISQGVDLPWRFVASIQV